jgi:hypothetical protein
VRVSVTGHAAQVARRETCKWPACMDATSVYSILLGVPLRSSAGCSLPPVAALTMALCTSAGVALGFAALQSCSHDHDTAQQMCDVHAPLSCTQATDCTHHTLRSLSKWQHTGCRHLPSRWQPVQQHAEQPCWCPRRMCRRCHSARCSALAMDTTPGAWHNVDSCTRVAGRCMYVIAGASLCTL